MKDLLPLFLLSRAREDARLGDAQLQLSAKEYLGYAEERPHSIRNPFWRPLV